VPLGALGHLKRPPKTAEHFRALLKFKVGRCASVAAGADPQGAPRGRPGLAICTGSTRSK